MIIDKALSKVFGTKHERDIKAMTPRVEAINALEPEIKALSDDQIRARMAEIRARVQEGLKSLPEDIEEGARADPRGPRHGARRGLRPRARGRVAHDRAAPLRRPAHRRHGPPRGQDRRDADGRGQDARRDARRLAERPHRAAASTSSPSTTTSPAATPSGWAASTSSSASRSAASSTTCPTRSAARPTRCDITYGTNNEFGFDYLRDNMKFELAADGPARARLRDRRRGRLDPHRRGADAAHHLGPVRGRDGHLLQGATGSSRSSSRARRSRTSTGTRRRPATTSSTRRRTRPPSPRRASTKCERLLGVENLYDPTNIDLLHACQQALRAHTLYKRDVDYVVKDGQVLIVDEFTGRLMPGRRWSDGLHQAVEAKEGVKIEKENQTLATITLQNYFRMYDKLAGMTGTADTEAAEFDKIYKLDVVVIPTNRDMVRIDEHDLVYRTEREKFEAVVEEIAELQREGPARPRRHDLDREVRAPLDACSRSRRCPARRPEREVPRAGGGRSSRRRARSGAVTIATNMAGRGTDILLGGNPEYLAQQKAKDEDPEELEKMLGRAAEGHAPRRTSRSSSSAASTSSAPSGTSRAASTTSSAAAPAARATRAPRASTSRSRTT